MLECEGGPFRLVVIPAVSEKLDWYMQRTDSSEVGGILLGYLFEDRIEIIQAVGPSPLDRAGPHEFVRSKEGAQLLINGAWRKSDGRLNYVGEWHSHAEINPSPSPQDKEMLASALRSTRMDNDFLIMMILGVEGTFWVGIQTANGLVTLVPREGT